MTWTEHRFVSFDETPIFYRRSHPDQSKKAVLIVVHGLGEHGGRYRKLGDYLAGMGIVSILADLRGHGLSGGRRVFARRFEDYWKDLSAILRIADENKSPLPLVMLGHSLGGLIAASFLAFRPTPKVDGLILSSACFEVSMRVPRTKLAISIILNRLYAHLLIPDGIDTRQLTHDAEILSSYEKDPLICRCITPRLAHWIRFYCARRRQIAQRLVLPLLMLCASDDRIVSNRAQEDFFGHLKSRDKVQRTYEDFYHEILQEKNRGQVFDEIGAWIFKRAD